ncbi:DNA repair protein RecO [Candidatus Marinamargulisbacteria bacterium SCGC AAA071-K20]|nr:DNA repair protein RecO [Candidatus Marinamargulisbacteria bacterium SCGC AAA071-K20]
MKTYKLTGIVLKKQDLFEKDKTIDLFTPDKGKIQLLAKYANTKSFKFSGTLEATNYIEVVLYIGKSFHIITHAHTVKSFTTLRTSFNHIAIAVFLMDLAQKATMHNQENPDLFEILLASLNRLNELESVESVKSYFFKRFLEVEGLLHESNTLITDKSFQNIFETYTNQSIKFPKLLTPHI